jgi:molecular chaperone GrpE
MEIKKSKKENERITELARQNAELIGDLQRTRADFENFRKQVDIQKDQAKKLATDATILKLLPLIDDMSRAIASNKEALAPVEKTLEKTMNDLGLSKIETAEGTEFNPDLHDAISMDESTEGEKEVIAEELRPGYMYNGEVLRAAMVRVKRV